MNVVLLRVKSQLTRRRALLQIILPFLVAFIPIITSLTLYRDLTGDDTYIHLVFARNIASDQGFAFNPGEPTYGASSPIWVFLIAATSLVTHEFFWTARVLSLLFSVAAILCVFLLNYRITNHFALSVGASFVFAIDPHFAKFASSGMETSLAISLVMIGLYLHMADMKSQKSVGISSVVLGIATLVRPECVLLFGSCLLDRLFRVPRSKWLPTAFGMVLPYLLIVGPWWYYAWLTFGRVVPNTASAKSFTTLPAWVSMQRSVLTLVRLIAASYSVVVILLIVGIVGWIRKGIRQSLREWNIPLAALLWLVAWPAIQVFKGVDVVARYFLLVSPLLIIAAFVSMKHLDHSFPKVNLRLVFFLSLCLITISSFLLTALLIHPAAIEFTEGFEAVYIDIGKWLEDHTPLETTVAVADIGAIGYFSHRRVFDLGGLVTPEAIPYLWGNEGRFVERVKPDYLVIRKMGSPPAIADWGMVCVETTPVLTRTFYAAGSRTLGIPQFSTLYKLNWTPDCSSGPRSVSAHE